MQRSCDREAEKLAECTRLYYELVVAQHFVGDKAAKLTDGHKKALVKVMLYNVEKLGVNCDAVREQLDR